MLRIVCGFLRPGSVDSGRKCKHTCATAFLRARQLPCSQVYGHTRMFTFAPRIRGLRAQTTAYLFYASLRQPHRIDTKPSGAQSRKNWNELSRWVCVCRHVRSMRDAGIPPPLLATTHVVEHSRLPSYARVIDAPGHHDGDRSQFGCGDFHTCAVYAARVATRPVITTGFGRCETHHVLPKHSRNPLIKNDMQRLCI
jgi:hypothetical protein